MALNPSDRGEHQEASITGKSRAALKCYVTRDGAQRMLD